MATVKELETKLAQLETENANLVAAQPKPREPREIKVKYSETTGSIVVSGLSGRFPTTLYRSSWKRLLTKSVADMILNYIKEHDAEITATMKISGKVDR